jgi:hypothetical protein
MVLEILSLLLWLRELSSGVWPRTEALIVLNFLSSIFHRLNLEGRVAKELLRSF